MIKARYSILVGGTSDDDVKKIVLEFDEGSSGQGVTTTDDHRIAAALREGRLTKTQVSDALVEARGEVRNRDDLHALALFSRKLDAHKDDLVFWFAFVVLSSLDSKYTGAKNLLKHQLIRKLSEQEV